MQVYQYACLLGSVVLNFAYLDFALFEGAEYRVYDRTCGLAVRNLGDGYGFIVYLLDFGTYAYASAAASVIVFADIQHSAGGEVGIQLEVLAAQVCHSGINDFIEIVRHYTRR